MAQQACINLKRLIPLLQVAAAVVAGIYGQPAESAAPQFSRLLHHHLQLELFLSFGVQILSSLLYYDDDLGVCELFRLNKLVPLWPRRLFDP
jgi:hypothetical protein